MILSPTGTLNAAFLMLLMTILKYNPFETEDCRRIALWSRLASGGNSTCSLALGAFFYFKRPIKSTKVASLSLLTIKLNSTQYSPKLGYSCVKAVGRMHLLLLNSELNRETVFLAPPFYVWSS